MKWNNIEYMTFQEIFKSRNISEIETIHHIELALKQEIYFAYYEQNGILVQYSEATLPESLAFRLYHASMCPDGYKYSDHLMFFLQKLCPKERIAKVTSIEKITVNISSSLWAGLTKEKSYSALSAEGFSDEVIAFILIEKLSVPKGDAGRLFYSYEILKTGERDTSTYIRKIDNLLNRAKEKYLFTFSD